MESVWVWDFRCFDLVISIQFKLRQGPRLTAQLRPGPSKLGKYGQTWVNVRRVIQLFGDQFDASGDLGWRTLRLMFKALIASISASVKSNKVQSRLDNSLCSEFVFGMTAMPLCVAQRRRAWAGSGPIFSSLSHANWKVTHPFHGPEQP